MGGEHGEDYYKMVLGDVGQGNTIDPGRSDVVNLNEFDAASEVS